MANLELSVLIPTYNESEIILGALDAIAQELKPELCQFTEVIIVDDGKDDLPLKVKSYRERSPFAHIEVLRNERPLGKGASLSRGFEKARGKIAGFLDVDLSTPPRYIHQARDMILTNKIDAFIGSRYIAGAHVTRQQSWMKDFLGRLYGIVALDLVFHGMKVYIDSQCGFKFYKNHIAKVLYHNLWVNDGLHDIEVLIRANLLGVRVHEEPVEWIDVRESKRTLSRILLGEMVGLTNILVQYKLLESVQKKKLQTLAKQYQPQGDIAWSQTL